MIKDRASFIMDYVRDNKTIFIVEYFNNFKTYIAANRKARRLLNSNKIKNLAKKKGAKIEIDAAYSCIF